MRVSINWLRELVSLDTDVENLAERLSISGFEVEEIIDLKKYAEGIITGFVVKCEKHPNADKLSVCSVDIGKEILQIVCGAKNIKSGIHVPVAIKGTILLKDNLKIKENSIRGVESHGMICSLQELGLESKSEGICIFEEITNEKLLKGENVAKILNIDDIILELAITANRPDGLSHYGIAREISAVTDSKLLINELKKTINFNFNEFHNCFDSKEADFIYSLTKLANIDNKKDIPSNIKGRLKNCGINSKNLVVDITNYIMLEQGQPLHAFDEKKLENITNNKISKKDFAIRFAQRDEEFKALDCNNYKLNEETLLITCHDIPIAIAGIIGGIETSVDENTESIWLESAVFPQEVIRTSSRSIGIRTESSTRFEKGIPVDLTNLISNKASEQIKRYTECKIIESWTNKVEISNKPKVILRYEKVNEILGPLTISIKNNKNQNLNIVKEVTSEENFIKEITIERCLDSLGCFYEKEGFVWSVSVPPHRAKDLTREIDLIEEIARIIGYDNFSSFLPDPIQPGGLLPDQKIERQMRILLSSSGLNEVTTISLINYDKNDKNRVKISNPLFAETSCLRTNMWQEHLNICLRNINAGSRGCWIYEIGKVFKFKEDCIQETSELSGVICGHRQMEIWTSEGKYKGLSFFEARGILEKVMYGLKINFIYKTIDNVSHLHAGRTCEILVEGKPIGIFGQLSPNNSNSPNLPKETYLFKLDLKLLIISASRKAKLVPTLKDYNLYPYIERDIAIKSNDDVKSSDIINLIRKSGKPYLENVELIDIYTGDTIEEGKVGKAFRIRYRKKDGTLKEEDIKPIQEKIRERLVSSLDIDLRS
tara:strand:- start:48642 stop:51131 length:2490 start_codon:yes stop_codon:yes gene_type:complete